MSSLLNKAAATAILGLAGLQGLAQAQERSVIEDVLAAGEIRAGMSTFVPWVMRSKDGEYIGFEVDVARELAKDMGVELEIVLTPWEGIIPALQAREFDVIIGGMSITAERNLEINFSRPYSQSGLVIVANRDKAAGLDDLEDFNSGDVVFSMREGVAALGAVARRFPRASVRLFDDEATVIQQIVDGNATAWVAASSASAAAAVADHGDKLFLPFEETFEKNNEGFGVRKGDPDALNFFGNWILTKLESGWLQERHAYWFKTRDWVDQVAEQ